MTRDTTRTLLRHLVAVDLVVLATGIGLLFPDAPVVLFLAFLAAVAASAWWANEEVGLAATAYAVIVLSLVFRETADVTALTAFAATGAAVAAFARVARRVRAEARPQTAEEERAAAVAPLPPPSLRPLPTDPFPLGLPLLVVVLYADISDVMMSRLPVPSLLRPLILLLAFVAWKYRHVFRPSSVMLRAPLVLFALYSLYVFATGVWARDGSEVDARFSELTKALFICILAASLTPTWTALRRAFVALIAAATIMAAVSVLQVATGRFENLLFGLVTLEEGNIYGEVSAARASGPPVHDPNFYARILLVAIPLAVVLFVSERRRLPKIGFAAAAAIVTAGTLATYSRGAMLTVGVMGALLWLALEVPRRYLGGTIVAGALCVTVLPASLTERFLTVGSVMSPADRTGDLDSSVEQRRLLVGAALRMFDDHPIAGVGAGNYASHYEHYAKIVGSSHNPYLEAGERPFPHGLYFELAAETGLIGLATFCAAAAAALLALFRARRTLLARGDARHAAIAAGVAVALAGYLVSSILLHETHARYFGLYLGFAIAVTRLSATRSEAAA